MIDQWIEKKIKGKNDDPSTTAKEKIIKTSDAQPKGLRRTNQQIGKRKWNSVRNSGRPKQKSTCNGGRAKPNNSRFEPVSNAFKGSYKLDQSLKFLIKIETATDQSKNKQVFLKHSQTKTQED